VRILVIEDDAETAAYLQGGLQEEGHVVTLAADGRNGLMLAATGDFDVLVVDRMLPGLDGLAVVRTLRASSVGTPALFLTTMSGIDDRVTGLDAGADDYLVKPFSFSELLARIRALLRRPVLQTANKLASGDISMDLGARTVTRGAQTIVLTPREFAVLEYLLRHPGQALSRSQIAERVWSWEFHGETNIVDVYIGYLRRKLDEGGAPSVIETLRGYGYRLKDEARGG